MRPKTRNDCHRVRLALVSDLEDGDPYKEHRPCPFVSCRFHLHTDIDAKGVVTIIGGDIAHTCALDIVDEHPDGVSREQIADVLRVSEERTRLFERRLEAKVRLDGGLEEWRGHRCDQAEGNLGGSMEA